MVYSEQQYKILEEEIKKLKKENELKDKDIKYGYIIAKCKLVDCIYMDEEFVNKIKKENPTEYMCGEYAVGRYAWILEDIKEIEPIQAKGHLGIWNYENL